jgi:hypothetical protein
MAMPAPVGRVPRSSSVLIEQLAKILKISPDVLYFYAYRLPGDVMRDFDEAIIEAAYSAFRRSLKESCTTGQSDAQAGARRKSARP